MMVSDLELRDEFAFLTHSAVLSDVAKSLTPAKNKVVLIRAKKNKGIAGILKENSFLKACSEGFNPLKELARNHMSTKVLRIREDTPFEIAVESIRERKPDGVLVLTSENKFLGYLSTSDFREMEVEFPEQDLETAPEPGSVAEALELRDEFVLVDEKTNFIEIARKFTNHKTKVVLVRAKKNNGVGGVIPIQVFLQVCANGKDPRKLIAKTHMLTNLMRIRGSTPLQIALDAITERDPDATLVLDVKNRFLGYLSPDDFRSLQMKVNAKKGEETQETIRTDASPPSFSFSAIEVAPPLPADLLETVEIDTPELFPSANDELAITTSSVNSYLQQSLANGATSPVIWSEDGSEILVHTSSLNSTFENGLATFSIDLECDQCGREMMEVRYYLGTKDEMQNLHAVIDAKPKSHPLLVARWAKPMQDVIWGCLIELVEKTTRQVMGQSNVDSNEEAVSADDISEFKPSAIGAEEGQLWVAITTPNTITSLLNQTSASSRLNSKNIPVPSLGGIK